LSFKNPTSGPPLHQRGRIIEHYRTISRRVAIDNRPDRAGGGNKPGNKRFAAAVAENNERERLPVAVPAIRGLRLPFCDCFRGWRDCDTTSAPSREIAIAPLRL